MDADTAGPAPMPPQRPATRRREEPPPKSTATDAAGAAPSPAHDVKPQPRMAGGAGAGAAAAPEPTPTDAVEQAYDPTEETAPAPQASQQQYPSNPEDSAAQPNNTKELLRRRFSEAISAEAERSGENLSFDFRDEPHASDSGDQGEHEAEHEDRWEVGDPESPPRPARSRQRVRRRDADDAEHDPGMYSAIVHRQEMDRDDGEFERIRPEEVSAQARRLEAELRGSSYRLHSAGYFIGLFAMVILGFGLATIVIQSAPLASAGVFSALPLVGQKFEPPVSAARRVALSNVQAQYTRLKSNQTALVISGNAENLTSAPLGIVQIEAALTGSNAQPLRTQAVYCGNNLSPKMMTEMTPREIQFFGRLDQPKNFTLPPQTTAPFVIVFIDPPAGISHFQLRVLRADAAPAASPAAGNGG
jgi:hypothetical protein